VAGLLTGSRLTLIERPGAASLAADIGVAEPARTHSMRRTGNGVENSDR